MVLAASLALSMLVARPDPVETAILVRISANPKFQGMAKEEAYNALRDGVWSEVRKQMIEYGYEPAEMTDTLTDFEKKFDSRKAKDKATWAKLAQAANLHSVLLVDVTGWSIKNADPGALARNPKLPGSTTKVSTRFYWFDSASGLLTSADKPAQGTFLGGYFGTTDRDDMMGSPDAEALEIRNGNRKRMNAIAKATWDSIRFQIPKLAP